jgi:hypothetical protein
VTPPRSVRVFLFILFLLAAVTYVVTGVVLDVRGPYFNGGDTTVEALFRINTISWRVAITSLGINLIGLLWRLTDLLASRSPLASSNQASDA